MNAILNDALPVVTVNPETCELRADGALPTCPPTGAVPMARRCFLF